MKKQVRQYMSIQENLGLGTIERGLYVIGERRVTTSPTSPESMV